ncbi:hypothetical protein TNCV_3892641, partial [Trichonephila clavipes]
MRAIGKVWSCCSNILGSHEFASTTCKYLGDGDSNGFLTIKEAKVYGDTEVEKLECVGHVQKAYGHKAEKHSKTEQEGIKLSDENISGRGRLTLKEVDSIQHYYGLATG